MGSNNGNGSKPEHGGERGELGRYTSEAAKAKALANLRPITSSSEAVQLGQFSGSARRDRAQFRHELNKLLDRRIKGERRTMRQKAAAVLIDEAVRKRNMLAMRTLIERTDGTIDFDEYVSPERVIVVVNRNVPRFATDGKCVVTPLPPPLHE